MPRSILIGSNEAVPVLCPPHHAASPGHLVRTSKHPWGQVDAQVPWPGALERQHGMVAGAQELQDLECSGLWATCTAEASAFPCQMLIVDFGC